MSKLALKRINEAKQKRSKKLDLSGCGLTELPDELFELTWLEEFITYKPSDFFDVKENLWFRFLYFFNLPHWFFRERIRNKIKQLNPRIKELQELKKLDLFGIESVELSLIKDLSNLQELWVSDSKLKDLSPLKNLKVLQYLVITHSQVKDLTPLKNLLNLQIISIGSECLKDLSPLNNLQRLKKVRITFSEVSDLSPLKDLQSLKEIDIGYTIISDLSPLKDLHGLQKLDVRKTNVSDLSPLMDLQNLEYIDISSTQVSDLSPLKHLIEKGLSVSLGSKKYRNEIDVEDCPLSNPPKAIVEQGNAAILNYFRQIEEQGTVPLYEAKLIMVGEPGAGKTSLTEKLLDETYKVIPKNPNVESTLGINIRENWAFPDRQRQTGEFTCHIWDFGGQEIQYMTHQFFLSPESLYVLVADDRKQHTLFPYWFEVIHLLGKDDGGLYSPIIVVLNEHENKSITNFDLSAYRLKYPSTQIDVLEVNLADENLERFRALRTKIQQSLCKLHHIGRPLPSKWPLIREAILDLNSNHNHISQTEFSEICGRFGIERKDDRELIGKYLHRLGIILHFQGDIQLRNFIIINPKWALKAVYAVLENKDAEKRCGRFTDTDLDNYWQDLSVEERSNILNLMKKDSFEICYPIGNNTYIAPQLLAQIRPIFKWDNTASLKCQFFYRFMPKGIITRLIVRKHEFLANKPQIVWARGAIFRRFNCDILVTEEETERNGLIAIEVNGKETNKSRALNFIRDEIEEIHRTWFPQIKYDERAPCNCDYCRNSSQPTFFDWTKLTQRFEESHPTIECDNGKVKSVPILPLMEGYTGKERIESLKDMKNRDRGFDYIRDNQPFRDEKPTINIVHLIMKNKSSIILLVLVVIFFVYARDNSEFEIFNLFRAKQGQDDKPIIEAVDPNLNLTIVGSIKLNNRNATAEEVKKVYIKGNSLVAPTTLSGNIFRLAGVDIPKDKLIEISVELKGISEPPSAFFRIPKANKDNIADLGEVLIEYKQVSKNSGKPSSAGRNTPFIINNINIVNK